MERKSFAELMEQEQNEDEGLMTGLDYLQQLENRLRKMDLAQIGYLFLSQIGEANHNSWDSVPREELIGINNFFCDMIFAIDAEGIDQKTDLGLYFGGRERWDAQGRRSER